MSDESTDTRAAAGLGYSWRPDGQGGIYLDYDGWGARFFGGLGCDQADITRDDVALVRAYMGAFDANVTVVTFAETLASARDAYEEMTGEEP